VSLRVSCFGKLPFHREFLRLGIDSRAAAWLVRWVEGAHEAWTRTGGGPETSPCVRFAAVVEGVALVGVARQSSDGLRRHPVALFVEQASQETSGRWHLMPLACQQTWNALANLLAGDFATAGAFTTALQAGAPAADVAAAGSEYAGLLAESSAEGPWTALSARPGAAGRDMAHNLLTVALAQRGATSQNDGVAMAVPLPVGPRAMGFAALWLDVFGVVAGGAPREPVLLLGGQEARLVALYRPAEGRDLAAVLSSLDMGAIDDLSEPWQPWPPAEPSLLAAVHNLIAPGPASFASLLTRAAGIA
jgi:hypothetical protein